LIPATKPRFIKKHTPLASKLIKKLNYSPIHSIDIKDQRCLAIMEEEQEESTEMNNNNNNVILSNIQLSSSNAMKVISIDLSMT
jgi:hypothetical protein